MAYPPEQRSEQKERRKSCQDSLDEEPHQVEEGELEACHFSCPGRLETPVEARCYGGVPRNRARRDLSIGAIASLALPCLSLGSLSFAVLALAGVPLPAERTRKIVRTAVCGEHDIGIGNGCIGHGLNGLMEAPARRSAA